MRWSKLPWGGILAMVYVTVMPLVLGIAAQGERAPQALTALGSQTAAAWVQAVGSVGAIIGLFLVAQSEAERSKMEKAREAGDRAKLFLYLVGQVHEAMTAVLIALRHGTAGAIGPDNFPSLIDMLDEIQMFDLPDERLALHLLSLRRATDFFHRHLIHWHEVAERRARNVVEPDDAERRAQDLEHDPEEWRAFKLYEATRKMAGIQRDVQRRLFQIRAVRDEFAARVGDPLTVPMPNIDPGPPGGFVV